MARAALLSLLHERGKLVAALAGVAFAATLAFVQVGLYRGFRDIASCVILNMGGDLWVMPRGTEVMENGALLAAGSRAMIASHPCVEDARGVTLSYVAVRKSGGVPGFAILVGYETRQQPIVPWTLSEGLPHDLHAPLRIAVDRGDLQKLRLPADPLRSTLEIGETTAHVAAVTEGTRSFTLSPFVFAEMHNARIIDRIAEGQVRYWVVQLRDPACRSDAIAWIERHLDLTALPTARWAEMTADHWVGGSGAGMALALSSLLGLLVGAVIVGETLYSITKDHRRVLATLKALGATGQEVAAFVAWQALFLAVAGIVLGGSIAFAVRHLVARAGLVVVLSDQTLALGVVAVVLVCVAASLFSVRAVWVLDPAEVLR